MVGTSRTLTDPLEMVIVVDPWAMGKLSGEVNAGQEIVAVPTARVPVASNSVSEMSVVAWARQITEPPVRAIRRLAAIRMCFRVMRMSFACLEGVSRGNG